MDKYNVIGYKEYTPYGVAIRRVEVAVDKCDAMKAFLEGMGCVVQYIVLRYA